MRRWGIVVDVGCGECAASRLKCFQTSALGEAYGTIPTCCLLSAWTDTCKREGCRGSKLYVRTVVRFYGRIVVMFTMTRGSNGDALIGPGTMWCPVFGGNGHCYSHGIAGFSSTTIAVAKRWREAAEKSTMLGA